MTHPDGPDKRPEIVAMIEKYDAELKAFASQKIITLDTSTIANFRRIKELRDNARETADRIWGNKAEIPTK